MIKVSDYIAQRLKQKYKINNIFLISGGGSMHLNDSFGRAVPYTTAHNEQALAFMAEGYARINQELAVINVTTGPGGLNCLNGVFGQWTDSVPVLYISGQVKLETTLYSCPQLNLRQLGDQETNIIKIVKPLTKYAALVDDPLLIGYHLDQAIYYATTGRKGPVWLDIPLNVQSAIIDENLLKPFIPPQNNSHNFKIDDILVRLQKAEKPLIIAGHGIHLSKQESSFLQLLNKMKIPVVTTFNGMGLLPDEHPSFAGRIGTLGQRAGNFTLQNADLILCLGTRNNIRQVSYNYENYAKNAYKIAVDIDSAELEKPTVIPDLKIHADLSQFLPLLAEQTPIIERPEWLAFCKNLQDKYHPSTNPEYQHSNNKINPYGFAMEMSKLLDKNAIIVSANATASLTLFQAVNFHCTQRVLCNSGNASMGYGLPAAIGACLSGKDRQIICLEGDGSIMMNIQELQTIKHYNLPIKIFIINNNGYISIKQTQNNFFEGRMTGVSEKSGVSVPDFRKIGKAFNIFSIRIADLQNLKSQLTDLLNIKGPALCEIMVGNDYIFTPKLSAKKLDDGTMISPSLEDMFPFLDKRELESNIFNKIKT